jgi:cytoskeleton protein RodZ
MWVEGMARGNFGERLKRERELREVTLQEITSATRIGPRFLEALENEEWEKLPGGVFNRGFVRSIARYLGLDEEALLGEYDLAHGAQLPAAEEVPEQPQSRLKPALIALFFLILLAGAIYGSYFAWKYYAARRTVQQVPAASTSASTSPQISTPILPSAEASVPASASNSVPVSAPISSSSSPPATKSEAPAKPITGPLDLLVSASAPTHLLVLVDGRVAFYDEIHSGQSMRFTAEEGFEVTASDSEAVLLELNGKAMPALGLPGSSGTIKLSHDDLRQTNGRDSKP